MDANEDQCSICWDSYKLPKLLQCRHTFCCTCLKSYVRKSRGRSELNCPLCRQSWWIPEDGVNGFMNNYFVEDTEVTAKVEPAECDICSQLFVLRECTHCAQKMCSNCALSHKEALKLAGESGYERAFDQKEDNFDSDSNSSGGNDSDDDEETQRRRRRRNSNVNIPFSLLLSLQAIKTKFKVDQVSVITMQRNIPEISHSFINCIHPVSDSECLVVPFAGPEILRYNFQGEMKSRIPLHSGIITSVLQRPDGSLLVSLWTDRSIICLKDDLVLGFYNTGEYSPHGMAQFPDGRVVFVGPNAKERKEGMEKTDSVKQCGTCQIMSKEGMFITEFSHDSEGPLFENPSSVAISPTAAETVAVADRGKRCVYLFLQDGTVIAKYTGGRHRFSFLADSPNFMPLNVCFDRNGNLLIADAAHRILHVINESGDFIGLIASHDGDFGQPFSIAVDFGGRIWIGDEADRTVKIFEIENFINCFAAENN